MNACLYHSSSKLAYLFSRSIAVSSSTLSAFESISMLVYMCKLAISFSKHTVYLSRERPVYGYLTIWISTKADIKELVEKLSGKNVS